ncbi:BEACH domain-containing protein, partial [Baffinella frigidus]
WNQGAISNYHYLLHLNQMAHRSFNDLAQYPIFPWIIADYASATLDLTSESSFRDLARPVGALNQDRLARLQDRARVLDGKIGYCLWGLGIDHGKIGYCLWGLGIAAIPAFFFEGRGRFDHADRAFASMATTWETCLTNQADVKELIPEFYQSGGAFLSNSRGLDLGTQHDGKVVEGVELPPWAKDPADFTSQCRKALESDYVSERIHEWIDLIFGYKQQATP